MILTGVVEVVLVFELALAICGVIVFSWSWFIINVGILALALLVAFAIIYFDLVLIEVLDGVIWVCRK